MQQHAQPNQSAGVGGLFRGLGAALRGLSSTMSNPEVWSAYARLVAALLVTTVVLGGAMTYGWWKVTGMLPDDSWLSSLGIVLFVVGAIIVALAAPLLALMVVNEAFPFFAEAVFFAGMRHIAPDRARALEAMSGLSMAASIKVAIAVLVKFLSLTILALLISLIPVVGTIAGPVFQLWITAKTLGWELLDPFFDKMEMRYGPQRDYVDQHSKAIVGFALPYSFVLAIPLIGPLFFGLAQAAAPVLIHDVLDPQ